MADDVVRIATYAPALDASRYVEGAQKVDQANKQVATSTERVEDQTNKFTRAIERLHERVDRQVAAENRRQAGIALVNRALEQQVITEQKAAALIAAVNARYEEQIAVLHRTALAGQALTRSGTALQGVMGSTQLAIRNVGFQVQDIFVQLQAGQNPFLILSQQGGQLAQGLLSPQNALIATGALIAAAAAQAIFFSDSANAAVSATKAYSDAIERSNEVLTDANQQSQAAAERKRQEALETTQLSLALEKETRARLEAQRSQIQAQAPFISPGADTLSTGDLDAKIAAAEGRIFELQTRIDQLIFGANNQRFAETARALDSVVGTIDKVAAVVEDYRKKEEALLSALFNGNISREEYIRLERLLSEARRKAIAEADGSADAEKRRAALLRDVARALEEVRNAETKRENSLAAFIDKLEEEARLAGETNRERAVGRALREAESKLLDELGQKTRDLTDLEKQRIENAVRLKVETEEQIKQREKLQRDIERNVERVLDNIADAGGQIIFDTWEGRSEDLWETFERLGKRALANLLAEFAVQLVLRPIISPIVAGAPSLFGVTGGGSSASSGFNLLSGLSDLGNLLAPLTSIGSAVAGLFGVGVSTAGLGGVGSAIGGGGAAAFGVGGTFISPTAATGIGAALVALPFVLDALGVFDDEDFPFAEVSVNPATGQVVQSDVLDAGDPSQVTQAVLAASQALVALATQFGVDPASLPEVTIGFNQGRGGLPNGLYTTLGRGGFGDVLAEGATSLDDAVADVIRRALLEVADELPQTVATVLRATQADTIAELQADLEFAAFYDELTSDLTVFDRAIQAVNQQFDALAKKAEEFGLSLEPIEEARQKSIDQATAALDVPAILAISGLRGFVSNLSQGPLTALTPEEQFRQAQRNFNEIARAAAGGDLAALQQFQGAATAYLTEARDRFASSPQYVEAFNRVLNFALQISQQPPDAFRVENAINSQTVTLAGELQALRAEVTRLTQIIEQGQMQAALAA